MHLYFKPYPFTPVLLFLSVGSSLFILQCHGPWTWIIPPVPHRIAPSRGPCMHWLLSLQSPSLSSRHKQENFIVLCKLISSSQYHSPCSSPNPTPSHNQQLPQSRHLLLPDQCYQEFRTGRLSGIYAVMPLTLLSNEVIVTDVGEFSLLASRRRPSFFHPQTSLTPANNYLQLVHLWWADDL